jgi:glucokinase
VNPGTDADRPGAHALRVGLDIGGTKTEAVAVDAGGDVVGTVRLPTEPGADAVVATAIAAVRALADELAIAPTGFASIGVGVPGAVDPGTGRVSHAVNLGVEGLELGALLAARVGRPVAVENDVNAAALGAAQVLGMPADASLAYLNLGTGLAAGLVLDGRLRCGVTGVAGEIGHLPVDPDGVLCRCGQRGCLETLASGSALARAWPTTAPDPVRALFDAADSGDADATAVRVRLLDSTAVAVRMLVLAVDVDVVALGGGVASIGAPLLDGVRGVLARWAADSPFLASLDLPGRVRLVPRARPVAAIGAALVGAALVGDAGVGGALPGAPLTAASVGGSTT